VDTSQPLFAPTLEDQSLTQMATIDEAMPFRVPISKDVEVSLMSLQVFMAPQIHISGLTSTALVFPNQFLHS
jgi:hypothetical protein